MLEEPTTLASVAFRVADTLRDEYGIDFVPVLADIGVDLSKRTRPGARVIRSRQAEIWRRAEELTGDPGIGIVVGMHSEPRDYYVLGHSWLASSTLKDAFERVIRYREVISNNVQPETFCQMAPQPNATICFSGKVMSLWLWTTAP